MNINLDQLEQLLEHIFGIKIKKSLCDETGYYVMVGSSNIWYKLDLDLVSHEIQIKLGNIHDDPDKMK